MVEASDHESDIRIAIIKRKWTIRIKCSGQKIEMRSISSYNLLDEKELQENLDKMNNRPRKCLGYKTPNEVFYE